MQFDRWDRGEIDSFDSRACASIPSGHCARNMEKYATTHLEPAVASAVAARVLRKEELPANLCSISPV